MSLVIHFVDNDREIMQRHSSDAAAICFVRSLLRGLTVFFVWSVHIGAVDRQIVQRHSSRATATA